MLCSHKYADLLVSAITFVCKGLNLCMQVFTVIYKVKIQALWVDIHISHIDADT